MTEPLPPGAAEVFDLWPGGMPLDPCAGLTEVLFANPDPTVPERWIRNIRHPTITHYPAKGGRGASILIVPGGAFQFVSIDNEGHDLAREFAARGIAAFVLKYRVHPMPERTEDARAYLDSLGLNQDPVRPGETTPPDRSPKVEAGRLFAEEDGRQAMRLLRGLAPGLGLDPARIGVIGFSAGGGVAVDLAFTAPPDCRPAFAAPIYPAYRSSLTIPADAPPTFIATAADDPLVAPFSAVRLAESCAKAGVSVALHVYGTGGHGFGIRKQGTLSDHWFDDFTRWLAALSLS